MSLYYGQANHNKFDHFICPITSTLYLLYSIAISFALTSTREFDLTYCENFA
jgi:hypothetical protein